MKRLKILMTNDDGIEFKGFRQLVKALGEAHDIYVFAPHVQRSACSICLTVYAPFSYTEAAVDGAVMACAVEGTPADCVKFAVKYFKIPFDLVISGPNYGSNLGTDILYSGTVGGATEGLIMGIKSIAVSQCLPMEDFGYCARFMAANLEKILVFEKPETLLNINFPPSEKYRGVKVAKQGVLLYSDYYDKNSINERTVFQLKGEREMEKSATHGSDILCINEGYVSITPLTLNRTDYEAFEVLDAIVKDL